MSSSTISTDAANITEDAFFSVSVTHTYPGGSETLTGLWDDPAELMSARDAVETTRPALLIKSAAATNIDRRDSRFDYNGTTYMIARMETDPYGTVRMEMTEA
ncbi:MAG: hypothetical protein D6800_12435 [Candidatus Zixiibacteriota bacterium]|nr:MAG: hypothetical protein D6800_12435 [candidate division Zixibacteria bacterium]